MSDYKILIALENTLESEKIQEILSPRDYSTTIFNWENTSNNKKSLFNDLKDIDLILTDSKFKYDKNFFTLIFDLMKKKVLSLILITTTEEHSFKGEFDLKEDIISLKKPFNSRELILTLELALHKKKMENALHDSEDKYRLLVENADDPIAIINYEGEFILVNSSAARFFGCDKEDFLGKTMWELFPKEYADPQMKNIRKVIETGQGTIIESKTMIRGNEYYFSTNIQPMPVKNGETGMVQLIARDITPMKVFENALKKSEEKFREVFNKANDGISLHHVDENGYPGNFVEVNDVVCERLGYTREELLKMGPIDIINSETKALMPEILEQLKSSGRATFEAIQVSRDGELITTEISNHLFTLQGKKMIMAVSRDISQRKKTEDQLLRILAGIENTTDAIGISMPDGSHFYHNQSFNELFGYSVEELNVPLGPVKLFKDPELGLHIFQTIMAGNDWSGELEMVDKSGRVFPAYIRANSIKNEKGKVIGLIGVLNDITERKRVEYALKVSEEKFRTLAQTAVDAIVIIDREEKIIFCNKSLERIFDYREEEILGEYLDTLIPKRYVEDFQFKLDYFHEQNLEKGNVFESFGMRKDRSEFPLEMSLNTWTSEGETYTTFIIRDITQRKLNEFKLKMREDIFQLMSQNIDEVFWIIDPLTGQILYMSPSYQKIWGQTIENLYQNPRSWIESMHPQDKDNFISYIFGKNGSTDREGIKCRVLRSDGNEKLIKVRAFPVINENKEIYRRIGIATDISKSKD
ncbi:MAG: PAS domain S-box protein [Methanobacteriaceae archaeon]|nr:PAS domain S-box protein [Methanobacteriaceae archaeon]